VANHNGNRNKPRAYLGAPGDHTENGALADGDGEALLFRRFLFDYRLCGHKRDWIEMRPFYNKYKRDDRFIFFQASD
jgi:hypothetical protein